MHNGAAAAAAAAAIFTLPRYGLGATDKLNLAFIGVGGQGDYDFNESVARGDVNVTAICDVDDRRLADCAAKPQAASARRFHDYRRMFDEAHRDFDAVVIATPDHHHAFATLAALRLGKHVYCEKPLTHSVWECRQV